MKERKMLRYGKTTHRIGATLIVMVLCMTFGLIAAASAHAAEPNDGTMQMQGSGGNAQMEGPCADSTTQTAIYYDSSAGRYSRYYSDSEGNFWSSDGWDNSETRPKRGARIIAREPEVNHQYTYSEQAIRIFALPGMEIVFASYYFGEAGEMSMMGGGYSGNTGVTSTGPIDQTIQTFGQNYDRVRILHAFACARPLNRGGVG